MLAPFFDKNLLSMSQLLERFDQEALLEHLRSVRVGLAIDASCKRPGSAKLIADLVTRLLARLYPRISVIALEESAEACRNQLIELARRINPAVTITKTTRDCRAVIVVGSKSINLKSGVAYYLSANDLHYRVSSSCPEKSFGMSAFSAGAAACHGAAMLFNNVFSDYLNTRETSSDTVELSFVEQFLPGVSEADFKKFNALSNATLVGVGAIGNGAVWALKHSSISGDVKLVDHEALELSNLQRYVCSYFNQVTLSKSEIARVFIGRKRNLKIHPVNASWAEHIAMEQFTTGTVGVAVDSEEDRIEIQASLPRRIVNSWTQKGQFGISRHVLFNDHACMACLYLPAGIALNEDELVAVALGFDPKNREELFDIRRRLQLDVPCDESFLNIVAEKVALRREQLLEFVGKPLYSLYQHGVCSTALLVSSGDTPVRFETPMAHQSALAGIVLLANMLVADNSGDYEKQPSITRCDLLQDLGHVWHFNATPVANCLCQDQDFKEVYAEKYLGLDACSQ